LAETLTFPLHISPEFVSVINLLSRLGKKGGKRVCSLDFQCINARYAHLSMAILQAVHTVCTHSATEYFKNTTENTHTFNS